MSFLLTLAVLTGTAVFAIWLVTFAITELVALIKDEIEK